MRVTALRRTGGWHKLVGVCLDGELALSLVPEAVSQAGLKVDGEVTGYDLAELLKTANRERCRGGSASLPRLPPPELGRV